MRSRDLVYLMVGAMPTVGEVVCFTPKRVRVAVRNQYGYFTVLRARHNVKLAKKAKVMA